MSRDDGPFLSQDVCVCVCVGGWVGGCVWVCFVLFCNFLLFNVAVFEQEGRGDVSFY